MKQILNSRKHWIILIIILQVAALAYIAIHREWVRIHGEVVYLSTAPVDPRDIFRGDYVTLDYNINRPNIAIDKTWLKQPLYATLTQNKEGIAHVTALSLEKPTSGLFIKARSAQRYFTTSVANPKIHYGIEKYFTEQGAGLLLEEKRGKRDEWQTSLEMQVALGKDGTAVIKGHRWAKVSTRLQVIEAGTRNNNDENARTNPFVKVSLRNNSEHSIKLLDSDQHCAFTLSQQTQALIFKNRDCSHPNWTSLTLAPNDVYEFEIDFEHTQWFASETEKSNAQSLADYGWSRFRFTYQPNALPSHKDTHYISPLKTAAFLVTGAVD